MVCLPAEKHHANQFSCSCSSKGCFSSPEPQTEGYRRDSLHFFFFCCVCMQIDVRVSACVYQNMWRLEAKSVSSSGELHFIGIERPEIHKLFFSELQGSACVCVPSCHTRMSYGCWSLLWHSKPPLHSRNSVTVTALDTLSRVEINRPGHRHSEDVCRRFQPHYHPL